MPTYVLDTLKRTAAGQKIAEVADLDGAQLLTAAKSTQTNGKRRLSITYRDAGNMPQSMFIEYVDPEDEHFPHLVGASQVGGSANAITLTPSPSITAYNVGDTFLFQAKSNSTGNVSVNISAAGSKQIRIGGTRAGNGDLKASVWYQITYDGTHFHVTGTSLGRAAALNPGTSSGDLVQVGSNSKIASTLLALRNGFRVTSGQVDLNIGAGFDWNGSQIIFHRGDGLKETAVASKAAKIDVDTGDGLSIASGKVVANIGDGLEIASGKIAVELDGTSLAVGSGGLKIKDGIAQDLAGVARPSTTAAKNYVIRVQGGTVSLVEAVFRRWLNAGRYTFTWPSDATRATVELRGGGGGGGNGASLDHGQSSRSADGFSGDASSVAVSGGVTVTAAGGGGGGGGGGNTNRGGSAGIGQPNGIAGSPAFSTTGNPVANTPVPDGSNGGVGDRPDIGIAGAGGSGGGGATVKRILTGLSKGTILTITVGRGGPKRDSAADDEVAGLPGWVRITLA